MSLHWATDVWLNTIGGVNGHLAASQNVDRASAAGVANRRSRDTTARARNVSMSTPTNWPACLTMRPATMTVSTLAE